MGAMLQDIIGGLNACTAPPFLGFIVFICLSLISLVQGGRNPTSYLLAGFCLSGALVSLDIALVSLIRDPGEALRIDRIVYLFFVFSIPVCVRFVHAFPGLSRRRVKQLNRDLERRVQSRTAELARALEEKDRAQNRLVQSESLAAVGQLVAGAAHELNSPLACVSSLIQTSLESLEREGGDDGRREDAIAEIRADLEFTLKELERVRDVVRNLLELSRPDQTAVGPVRINEVVEDALRILRKPLAARPETVLEKSLGEGLPEIEGNYAQLEQVLINIIRNAFQALPGQKGKITLATRCLDDRILFECRDTGTGISSENMKNIFHPFFTTREVGRGTGLGLYISHEIIKRHGGRIDAASGEGGTTVRVELPLGRSDSEAEFRC